MVRESVAAIRMLRHQQLPDDGIEQSERADSHFFTLGELCLPDTVVCRLLPVARQSRQHHADVCGGGLSAVVSKLSESRSSGYCLLRFPDDRTGQPRNATHPLFRTSPMASDGYQPAVNIVAHMVSIPFRTIDTILVYLRVVGIPSRLYAACHTLRTTRRL